MKNVVMVVLIGATMALLLRYPSCAISAASESLTLWWNTILPSLLPFFILSGTIVKSGVLNQTPKKNDPITKLLGLPTQCVGVMLLGAISGYPTGAKLSAEFSSSLSRKQLQALIIASNLSGPIFITGTIATALLGVPALGGIMLLSHYLGVILISVILSIMNKTANSTKATLIRTKAAPLRENISLPFLQSFIQSATESLPAMLKVGAFMIFFPTVFALLREIGIINILCTLMNKLFFVEDSLTTAVLAGLFEMSDGCKFISELSLSITLKTAICTFFVSFGGASVIMQTLAFAPIKFGEYVLPRLIGAFASAAICYSWVSILTVDVFAYTIAPIKTPWIFSLTTFILGLFIVAWLLRKRIK